MVGAAGGGSVTESLGEVGEGIVCSFQVGVV